MDRDGVIIENLPNYVRSWEEVKLIPGALEAISRLDTNRFRVVIVTNQSAVGRGIISIETAHEINKRLIAEIQQAGGHVDGVYMCPHSPEALCQCRKPLPGLILTAAQELDIDLSTSYMIGDALTDLAAGKAAGIPNLILVQTGRGKDQLVLPRAIELQPFVLSQDLPAAILNL